MLCKFSVYTLLDFYSFICLHRTVTRCAPLIVQVKIEKSQSPACISETAVPSKVDSSQTSNKYVLLLGSINLIMSPISSLFNAPKWLL